MRLLRAKLFGVAAVLALVATPASATPFQYTYQGNPFDTFVAGSTASQFTSANAVQFSFVTDSVIATNSTFNLTNIVDGNFALSPSVIGWSITDGLFSSGSALGSLAGAFVTTNSAGNIVSWQFAAQFSGPGLHSTIVSCGAAPCMASIGHAGQYAGEHDQITPSSGSFLYIGLATSPGSWSNAVAVPWPAAGAGLPGLLFASGGFLAWLRRRSA